MDNNSIQTKSNNRWMCNELVHELCLEIPTAKTSDSILLTAHNMYTYLAPGFSKKLIYRDALVFLKAKLNAKENVHIRIDGMARNKESGPIVVINQKQWKEVDKWVDKENTNFELETNKFHVQIRSRYYVTGRVTCWIYDKDYQFMIAHLQYFLRIIAPLLQQIQLRLGYNLMRILIKIPIEVLVHFLDTQSDWIDSIGLFDNYFRHPIYGAFKKYNRLEIYDAISPVNVPKLIHWLTSNNGQTKKCLFLEQDCFNNGLALLMDELKKDFSCATTSKSRFVVRLELRQPMDEFTLCNELTGEKLQLRRKDIEDRCYTKYIHALSRSPNNELDDSEIDFAELNTLAEIYLH